VGTGERTRELPIGNNGDLYSPVRFRHSWLEHQNQHRFCEARQEGGAYVKMGVLLSFLTLFEIYIM